MLITKPQLDALKKASQRANSAYAMALRQYKKQTKKTCEELEKCDSMNLTSEEILDVWKDSAKTCAGLSHDEFLSHFVESIRSKNAEA